MNIQKSTVKSIISLALGLSLLLFAAVPARAFDESGRKYYADFGSLEEAKAAASDLEMQIAAEGFILLKNKDDVLPLSGTSWVSVFGVTSDCVSGSRQTVAEVLAASGFPVNQELASFYAVQDAVIGQELTEADFPGTVKSSLALYHDAAIVVFSRTGEDGAAQAPIPSLTDSEKALLSYAKESCRKVIVVISSPHVMELGSLQNDDGIDALLLIGRPGAEGLAALGGILNGTVCPSGKTVDLYPADLTTDPSRYNGGLFNGYRYYETADAEAKAGHLTGFSYDEAVIYPFGYGLSYTDFTWEILDTDLSDWGKEQTDYANNGELMVKVKVTNVGYVPGKDVVEVYAHAPYTEGGIPKAEAVLVGFAKTDSLKPGKSQVVSIPVSIRDIASFDALDKNGNGHATYELDAGTDYALRLQSDSHHVKAACELPGLARDIILGFDDFSGAAISSLSLGADGQLPRTQNASDWAEGGRYALWKQAAYHAADFSDITIRLADMSGIDRYDDVHPLTNEDTSVAEFIGRTGQEAWDLFLNQLTWEEVLLLAGSSGSGTPAVASIGKDSTSGQGDPQSPENIYNWGDSCLLAATWNTDLAHRQGILLGNLGILLGTSFYGPVTDIRLSPDDGLCPGAYSQDGFQGGRLAAAVISGAQTKGMICHATYNVMSSRAVVEILGQEPIEADAQMPQTMDRLNLSPEQAAREISLKPLQLAIQEGGAAALLLSFEGSEEAASAFCTSFCTSLLRDEWGFKGYIVTSASETAAMESRLSESRYDAGNNQVLLRLPEGETASYTAWYFARLRAEEILYTQANMAVIKNGYDLTGFTGGVLIGMQGEALEESISVKLDSDALSYSLDGGLPNGLNFDTETGLLYGTPTQAGEYNIDITVKADNYITKSARYRLSISSGFTVDEDLIGLSVGDQLDAFIESDVIDFDAFDEVTFAVSSGTLPKGIALEDDCLTGTLEEAGVFPVTITITTIIADITDGCAGSEEERASTSYEFDVLFIIL